LLGDPQGFGIGPKNSNLKIILLSSKATLKVFRSNAFVWNKVSVGYVYVPGPKSSPGGSVISIKTVINPKSGTMNCPGPFSGILLFVVSSTRMNWNSSPVSNSPKISKGIDISITLSCITFPKISLLGTHPFSVA